MDRDYPELASPQRGRLSLRAMLHPIAAATTRRWNAEPRLIRQAQLPVGAQVLDLLCGSGTLAVALKSDFPDVRVIGIDRDPEALGRARRRAESAGVAVEFAQTVYTHLPLADSSFDRVLCSFGMHRLAGRELRLLLGEARRVLKPGGELHTTGVIRAAGPGPLPHWAAATERTMRIWLDVAGFDAVTSHGDMPLPDGTVEFVSARKPATQ